MPVVKLCEVENGQSFMRADTKFIFILVGYQDDPIGWNTICFMRGDRPRLIFLPEEFGERRVHVVDAAYSWHVATHKLRQIMEFVGD